MAEFSYKPESVRPLRRDEYDQLVEWGAFADEPVELLSGVLVLREPQSPYHASAVSMLADELRAQLGRRAQIREEKPLAISETSEPEPDIAVVEPRPYRDEHPRRAHLIVEVSRESAASDRSIKSRLYAEAKIPEYWVLDLNRRELVVHRRPTGRGYASVKVRTAGDVVSPLRFRDVKIDVGALFV